MVHGGIRHLEIQPTQVLWELFVHGGIRHLESLYQLRWHEFCVHGGIRHLENSTSKFLRCQKFMAAYAI